MDKTWCETQYQLLYEKMALKSDDAILEVYKLRLDDICLNVSEQTLETRWIYSSKPVKKEKNNLLR